MDRILAYCTNPACSLIFSVPSPFQLTGETRIVMQNNHTFCPRCGLGARMQDIDTTINRESKQNQAIAYRLVVETRESAETFESVKQVLDEASRTATSKEEVLEQVATKSTIIANFLKTVKSDSFQKWLNQVSQIIMVAIAILTFVKMDDAEDANKRLEAANKSYTEHLKEDIYKEQRSKDREMRKATPASFPKPERNKPCHCGSGRKYKNCCGLNPSVSEPRVGW